MRPDQLIRLECLKLAAGVSGAERGARTVQEIAAAYETFVRGADNPAAAGPASAQTSRTQDKAPLRPDRR